MSDWRVDETTALIRDDQIRRVGAEVLTQDLEILETASYDSAAKKPDVPIAYAEQVFLEPISVGTWHMPEANTYIEEDDNKDLVSFAFILLIMILCIVVIFYPFSYYDDDEYW